MLGQLDGISEGAGMIWKEKNKKHFTFHHQFYVKNANCKTYDFTKLISLDIADVCVDLEFTIRTNHSIFRN